MKQVGEKEDEKCNFKWRLVRGILDQHRHIPPVLVVEWHGFASAGSFLLTSAGQLAEVAH